MGSASSKAARKLPKRTEPSWAGARTPRSLDPPHVRPQASEARTEAIEKDSHDPDFLANLNRLGPVRVDHHMQTVRPAASDTSRLFKSRAQSEFEASAPHPTRNRLHAPSLSELLDERKSATSRRDLERLADKYGIDSQKLDNLSRFVSSPSVQAGAATRTVEKDGEESITMTAVWIEPHIPDTSPKTQSHA